MLSFNMLLKRAQEGNSEALEQILLLYKPLIDRHCRIDGYLDEDLQQLIIFRFYENLKKFQ